MDRPNRHGVMVLLSHQSGESLVPGGVRPRAWIRVRSLFFLQVLVLLVVASGCARSRVHYEEIFRNDAVHVRLIENLDKSGEAVPKSYDHPWDVEIEVLDAMLESVRYMKGKVVIGGKDSKEAFPALPRVALLKHIQSAFAQAGLDQAVDFSFEYTQSSLKIFRRVYLTDGILFRKGDRLNIAFRNLAFEQMGGEEEDNFEPNREDPTTGSPMRTSWTLVPGDGQSLVQATGPGILGSNTYTNWIRLDLSWPWGVTDAVVIEKAMPGMVDDLETLFEGDFTLPEPEPPSRAEIEERLQFLEELRREGTIGERSYIEKKRELDRLYNSAPK
jgi:hypothetical protein